MWHDPCEGCAKSGREPHAHTLAVELSMVARHVWGVPALACGEQRHGDDDEDKQGRIRVNPGCIRMLQHTLPSQAPHSTPSHRFYKLSFSLRERPLKRVRHMGLPFRREPIFEKNPPSIL